MICTCQHCGRRWEAHGAAETLVKGNARLHESVCATRSPAERRAANAADERRWQRSKVGALISNNPEHPGVTGKAE